MPDPFIKLGPDALRAQEQVQEAAQRAAEEADRTGVVQPDIEEVARRRAEERTQAEMMRGGWRGPAEERVEREGGVWRGRDRTPIRGPWMAESQPEQERQLAVRQVQQTMRPGMTEDNARSFDLAPTPEEAEQQVAQLPQGQGLRVTDFNRDPRLGDTARRALLIDPSLRQRLEGQALSGALLQLQTGGGDNLTPLARIPSGELTREDLEDVLLGTDTPRTSPNNVYTHEVNPRALEYLPSMSEPGTVGWTQEEVPAHEMAEGVERANAYGSQTSDARTFLGTAHPEGIMQQNRMRQTMGLPGERLGWDETVDLGDGFFDNVTYYSGGASHIIMETLPDGGARIVRQYTVPHEAGASPQLFRQPSGGIGQRAANWQDLLRQRLQREQEAQSEQGGGS